MKMKQALTMMVMIVVMVTTATTSHAKQVGLKNADGNFLQIIRVEMDRCRVVGYIWETQAQAAIGATEYNKPKKFLCTIPTLCDALDVACSEQGDKTVKQAMVEILLDEVAKIDDQNDDGVGIDYTTFTIDATDD